MNAWQSAIDSMVYLFIYCVKNKETSKSSNILYTVVCSWLNHIVASRGDMDVANFIRKAFYTNLSSGEIILYSNKALSDFTIESMSFISKAPIANKDYLYTLLDEVLEDLSIEEKDELEEKDERAGGIKILKFQWRPTRKAFKILVDKTPEFKYEQIGAFYYAETNNFVSVYEYKPGTKNGFAGAEITLKMKDGTLKTFKGSLWDPWKIPENIPPFRAVEITDSIDVYERGWTFCAGKITKQLYDELLEKSESQ